MGRRGRGGKKSNFGNRGDRRNDNRQGGGYQGYPEIDKANVDLERYYNDELKIIADEDERAKFWESLRTTLPNSFRFTGSKGHALTVQKILVRKYLPQISSITWEGKAVEPPQQLSWYPDQLAWSMATSKQVIRKSAPFAAFQKFLVSETGIGNISRQEVVSMIPPLLLDVQPHHTVLDLCAAPGSKSAQLAEMIHAGEEARIREVTRKLAEKKGRSPSPDGAEVELEKQEISSEDDFSDYGRSTGLLVANDVEWKRAQLLVHQIKRLNSPNYIVTNHDARSFPSILVSAEEGKPKEWLKFDRILADVPCTGDGTLRKNINIWKDWTRQNALGLHVTQFQILVRALSMLKVGGRVVYSTCSLNVIENESVIASAIDRCGGEGVVRIVDCSDKLPGLIRRPGLMTWPVVDRSGRAWSSWQEASDYKEAHGGEGGLNRISETMFPPPLAEAESLQRCMRFYPHLQDTGGFFVVVLEKLSEIRKLRDPRSERAADAAADEARATLKGKEASAQAVEMDDTKTPLEVLAAAPNTENASIASLDAVPNDLKPVSIPCSEVESTIENPPKLEGPLEAQAPTGAPSLKRSREDEDDQTDDATKRQKVTNGDTSQSAPIRERRGRGAPREEPFKYLEPDHSTLQDINKFYKIAPQFPQTRWMVRNATGEPVKAIYYTADLARRILVNNESTGMKFVHCGVKMFVKQDVTSEEVCRWRIQSEGLPIIAPWVGEERIVTLHKKAPLHKLLRETFVKVREDADELGEVATQIKDISMGCCILKVEPDGTDDSFEDRMVLPLWKSIFSLQLMLPKEDRMAMLLRVFDDSAPLVDYNKARMEAQAQAQESSIAPVEVSDDDEPGGVQLAPEPVEATEAEATVESAVDQDTKMAES